MTNNNPTNDPVPESPAEPQLDDAQATAQLAVPAKSPTAEQVHDAMPDEDLAQLDAEGGMRPMPMRKPVERIIGGLVFVAASMTYLYLVMQGRHQEITGNYVAAGLAAVVLGYSGTMLLPIPVAAKMLGLEGKPADKILRFRKRYAMIIPKGGQKNAEFVELKAPNFKAMNPPGIYDASVGNTVRIPKWIPRGTELLVFNQSNPQPVNHQPIYGYTAEHVHSQVGGLTQEYVTGGWAKALGLSTPNRKRLLIMAGLLVVGYLVLRWYQDEYGGSIFSFFGGILLTRIKPGGAKGAQKLFLSHAGKNVYHVHSRGSGPLIFWYSLHQNCGEERHDKTCPMSDGSGTSCPNVFDVRKHGVMQFVPNGMGTAEELNDDRDDHASAIRTAIDKGAL